MAISALDSRLFRNLFGTSEIRDVFSDTAYTQRMIDVEAALARAESAVGVIPPKAGDIITKALKTVKIDYERLEAETEIVGYPVLPLLRQLTAQAAKFPEGIPFNDDELAARAEAAKYIHWGATTQDIQDCASILQIKSGLTIVRRYLDELSSTLTSLSKQHRNTPMAGRTHLQHALPVTFGYKCAVYLSSIQRHLQRLNELEPRCLLVQFGGAAGTLASLGTTSAGLQVRAQLARELNLYDPSITWHTTRDTIAEILNFLALLSEVAEPFVPHRGASSTMPQKRNPISSEVILAASKVLRANAGLGLDAMVVDFERASGPWHLEWVAVPDSFVLCVGSLHQTCFVLRGLVVNEEAMLGNLLSTKGLIVGEAVMLELGREVGRQKGHDIVYKACKEAIEQKTTLLEVLREDEEVSSRIGQKKLAELCDPRNYLGASGLMVDRVIGGVQ
ncbi:uncharacterized protein AB675_7003 [Cyphellophora attinorum]|uniref:Adenylosuccinate lyase C-terminal domain-containing protein n=1 Tax=Cyphellophora attinorum TaxID=1664694 RepID=A0A0N1HEN8_9EURO|nr:uncharacterized protein AB675_7003 [Phialophora attinorum]KPI43362.1 hypothetical protein AB675_7003 [Phialophora attinorum]